MEPTFSPKNEVWRGRGHPRREVPAEVREWADATYRTGDVASFRIGNGENELTEKEATELRRLLKAYAKSRDLIMRIQLDTNVIRFEMADRPAARKKVAA